MNDNHDITIIGAGLVGSLLALGLAKKGYQVTVFESRPDLRKADISAGKSINLALANRGIRALKQQGIFDKVEPLLIPMEGRMVHIPHEDAHFQPYGLHKDDVIYSVSRGGLNALLLDEAQKYPNVSINFEHRVSSIDLGDKTIKFVDQDKAVSFSQIIGTDGANSVLRDAIIDKHQTSTNEPTLSIEKLEHGYKELCILPNSADQHKLLVNALHIWPREDFMLIALPNLDGSFTLTLFMANQGSTSFDSLTSADDVLKFFKINFPDVYHEIDNLTVDFFSNPIGSLATVRCQQWHDEGTALLLGDAAHAIVPFHGQGMNCGFEDCFDLLNLLPPAQSSSLDWQHIFEQTQALRKPNANAIADMALENYIEMRSSVAKASFQRQKAIAAKLQGWFPDRFSPRYAMVMFDDIQYHQAQTIGEVHKQLLTELDKWQQENGELTKKFALQKLDEYQL